MLKNYFVCTVEWHTCAYKDVYASIYIHYLYKTAANFHITTEIIRYCFFLSLGIIFRIISSRLNRNELKPL